MSRPLADKHVVVVGASSGIGSAIARRLAEAGGRVVVAARREREGRQVVDEIAASGGAATYYPVDVSDTEGVKALLEGDSRREETVLMLDKHGHTAVDMGKRYPEVVAAFEEFGITAAQNEASRPPSPLPASRAATPDIRARDVCDLCCARGECR